MQKRAPNQALHLHKAHVKAWQISYPPILIKQNCFKNT